MELKTKAKPDGHDKPLQMERGSSVVERRTRNQVSPGSKPLWYRFEDWAFSFSPLTPQLTQLFNEYLAIDSGGNVSDLDFARKCSVARMLPGEAGLVSEWTGLPGEKKSVKRSERTKGPDTGLYKNYANLFLFLLPSLLVITNNSDSQMFIGCQMSFM